MAFYSKLLIEYTFLHSAAQIFFQEKTTVFFFFVFFFALVTLRPTLASKALLSEEFCVPPCAMVLQTGAGEAAQQQGQQTKLLCAISWATQGEAVRNAACVPWQRWAPPCFAPPHQEQNLYSSLAALPFRLPGSVIWAEVS